MLMMMLTMSRVCCTLFCLLLCPMKLCHSHCTNLKNKINPEILRKRNPIVKYEVNVHIHERYILLCMIHVQRPVMSVLNSKTVYTLSDELNYLGLLNLLFSTLDYILSSFFSLSYACIS